jgi:hypothetical protein
MFPNYVQNLLHSFVYFTIVNIYGILIHGYIIANSYILMTWFVSRGLKQVLCLQVSIVIYMVCIIYVSVNDLHLHVDFLYTYIYIASEHQTTMGARTYEHQTMMGAKTHELQTIMGARICFYVCRF